MTSKVARARQDKTSVQVLALNTGNFADSMVAVRRLLPINGEAA